VLPLKKRFDIATVFALMLLVGITTWLFTFMATKNQLESQLETERHLRNELNMFVRAKNIIEDHFIGEWTPDSLQEGAVTGMVAALDDPWSKYLTQEEYNHYLNRDQITGIGISVVPHESGLLVKEVYPDSPASERGLRPQDVIIAINGVSYNSIGGFHAAADRIRGQPGEDVALTVRRDGQSDFTVAMTRREVYIQAIQSSIIEEGIGYMRIRNFNKGASADFKRLLDNLSDAGVEGLIIDVRNNPGGDLDTLCDILDLLLPEGPIIIVREKNGIGHPYMSGPDKIDLPIVVLCNPDSVSAAEFFAAALQEYGRAFIVGEKTLGKSYAQHTWILDDNSALILSNIEYLTPIHNRRLVDVGGVTPDLTAVLDPALAAVLPLSNSMQDTQLQVGLTELRQQIANAGINPEEDEPDGDEYDEPPEQADE
jgi:carboxyl-terminal processing protease